MKKTLLALTTITTAAAASIGFYVASLPNPTEMQRQLGNTANTVTIAGATALFGMLDEQDNQDKDDENS